MKTFLIRLSLYTVFTILFLGGYHFLIYKSLLDRDQHYTFSKGVVTLVVGDSHTEVSVHDSELIGLKNVSYRGESLFFSYYKLKKVFEKNPQIENVVMGFSYHNLNESQDLEIPKLLHQYYWLLDPKGLAIAINTPRDLRQVLKNINGKAWQWFYRTLLRGEKFEIEIGGYSDHGVSQLSEDTTTARIKRHFYKKDSEALQEMSALQYQYLKKITQLCKEYNVRLTFINTPLHKTYIELVPNDFIESYHEVIKNLEADNPNMLRAFDFRTLIKKDEYFMDGDHLNNPGSLIFSEYLIEQLKQ